MSVSLDEVRRLAGLVLAPANFFSTRRLIWRYDPIEERTWEVFRGRLLDARQTRQRRAFQSWGVYCAGPDGLSGEPVVGLKLDPAADQLHVVRGVDSYVWEGFGAAGVVEGREVRRWVLELIGTIALSRITSALELRDELGYLLHRAVVGARLPLAPEEAPLPGFTFGELFYLDRDGGVDVVGSAAEILPAFLDDARARGVAHRALEAWLRALPGETQVHPPSGASGPELIALLRQVFNDVSLSPWTDFTDKVLALVAALERQGDLSEEQAIDFIAHLLRLLARHLGAYDLRTFHHRGANYPDALLVDQLLAMYLRRIEQSPGLFLDDPALPEAERRVRRLRRRALRQGWVVRRGYEGHAVPDQPTSPGERMHVLPEGHPRIPEEQLLGRRQRRLFEGEPLGGRMGRHGLEALWQSVADLSHGAERRELGTGLFLDRPLGDGKAPAEADATLLLASLGYSRRLAEGRLRLLQKEPGLSEEALRWFGAGLDQPGVPVEEIGSPSRPGTVSLTDARRSGPDWQFLRTVPGSVRALLKQFDFAPLAGVFDLAGGPVLLARAVEGDGLVVYDGGFRPRVKLRVRAEMGYTARRGQEYPVGGLDVTWLWDERGMPGHVPAGALVLAPRVG
jgi:hypothetical protein